MGPICSNSQMKRKESKQIQTDQIVEQINNNTNIFNSINIVIELIYDIINDLNLEQKQEVYIEQQMKIEVHQDIEQKIESSVSEQSYYSVIPSQNPPPSITLENEQEPYSQLLQSMIVKKKEKLQVMQLDIQLLDYSPIKQEFKSQSSEMIQSVEPFNLDFESSSSSSDIIQWNQEHTIDSNGDILVIGIVIVRYKY